MPFRHLPLRGLIQHLRDVRAGQYFALKDVVGDVDAHEQPCIKHYRGRRELGARNPCGRKGQERHHKEMGKVDPYQSQRWRTYEPHKVMMVDPNNGDEEVAYRIADGRVPQRSESREYRLVGCLELQYHDGHNHREHRVRECT